MKKVRTRFAPSPTGFMHIGNLRSALFEYLVAKGQGGDFILRIEDTDQTRYVEGAVQFIYDTLKVCNMEIDEGPLEGGNYGPYTQSERVDLYKKYAEELVEKGYAYYCFCSEERLEKLREEADIRKVAFMYDGHCQKLSKEEVQAKIAAGENCGETLGALLYKASTLAGATKNDAEEILGFENAKMLEYFKKLDNK